MDWYVISKDVTASTSDDAKTLIEKHEITGPTLIFSYRQENGRGRYNRVWSSPIGNFYGSFIINREPDKVGYVSFISALAVLRVLKGLEVKGKINCKWPNDVLVDGKKISGILIEGCEDKLVVGIGINVRVMPYNTMYPTTSLLDQGVDTTPDRIRELLCQEFGDMLIRLEKEGFWPLREEWMKYAYNIGGKIQVNTINEKFLGKFVSVTEEGFLLMEEEDGNRRTIRAGDVFYI